MHCLRRGDRSEMDFLSLIILAGAILCFILVAFYLRLFDGIGNLFHKNTEDEDLEDGFPEAADQPREETGLPAEDTDSAKNVPGSHLLFIPPRMQDDARNADIRSQVEETVRGFRWDADGGKTAFIYACRPETGRWKCPYCEGENRREDRICMICGRSPQKDEL